MAPMKTRRKNLDGEMVQPLAGLFSLLCSAVNMEVDTSVPGQIMPLGRTRY